MVCSALPAASSQPEFNRHLKHDGFPKRAVQAAADQLGRRTRYCVADKYSIANSADKVP